MDKPKLSPDAADLLIFPDYSAPPLHTVADDVRHLANIRQLLTDESLPSERRIALGEQASYLARQIAAHRQGHYFLTRFPTPPLPPLD